MGGTVVDPRLVGALAAGSTAGRSGQDPPHGLAALSPREMDVLSLMAQGRTNSAIAERLVVSQGTVEKRVAAVFDKLDIPGSPSDNRRVLAVLRYLAERRQPAEEPVAIQPELRRPMLTRVA
ncbi:response regulator transcription factor [Streptomyces albus]